MSRLRREVWFTVHRNGRQTSYWIIETFRNLLDEGRERICCGPAGGLDPARGRWRSNQLSQEERQERDRLRRSLPWHGFRSVEHVDLADAG